MALQLAALPIEVVEAFASPVQLQLAWGAGLQDALKANREAVLKRALALKGSGKPAAEVYRELAGAKDRRAKVTELKVHGREVGNLSYRNGVVQLKLNRRTLDAEHLHEFRKLVQEFLAQRVPK